MSAGAMIHNADQDVQTGDLSASEQASNRIRLVKIVCAVLLGVAFWYAVPYSIPLKLDPDSMTAAAKEAIAYKGSLSREIAMPFILALSAYMLWRLPKRGLIDRHSTLMRLALCYVLWAAASTLWSVDPAISRKRIVVFLVNLVFIYALARCASMLEIAMLGFACTGTVALISLGVDLLIQHTFAPFHPDYRFMGVMTPNFQAMNLVVCLLCGLTLWQRKPAWSIWIAPLLMLFSLLLLITRARVGSFLCLAMVTFVLLRMAKLRLQRRTRALVIIGTLMIVAAAGAIAVARSGEAVLTKILMMGRNDAQNTASLSNRAPLWGELIKNVRQHPIAGFGFEAFWTAERVEKISNRQGWMVPHAHNTYLDQTLSLGLIGACLYTFLVIGGCVLAWRRYRIHRDESSLLCALLLTWLASLSLTESIPIAPNLPTLIAYSCFVKLFMRQNSEAEDDMHLRQGQIKGRLPGVLQPRLTTQFAQGDRA